MHRGLRDGGCAGAGGGAVELVGGGHEFLGGVLRRGGPRVVQAIGEEEDGAVVGDLREDHAGAVDVLDHGVLEFAPVDTDVDVGWEGDGCFVEKDEVVAS